MQDESKGFRGGGEGGEAESVGRFGPVLHGVLVDVDADEGRGRVKGLVLRSPGVRQAVFSDLKGGGK